MKTKKLLSVILTLATVIGMMASFGVVTSAKPASDIIIYVGQTQELRLSGNYSTEPQAYNHRNISVSMCSDVTDKRNNISILSVVQDGDEMVITIQGVSVTDADTTLGIAGEIYIDDENGWQDTVLYGAYRVKLLNNCDLDLDSTTSDILEKKELDQSYNLTVTEGEKVNAAKVKLTWEIKDIDATRTDNQVWDTTELKWVVASSNTTIMDKGTAKFTLENYSSEKVNVAVTFDTAEYATGKKFTAPTLVFDEDKNENTKDDGVITLDTANGNSTYSKENPPKGEIDVTVTPDADDFKSLSATSSAAKYGTYTVTISQAKETVTMTFTRTSSSTSLSYNGKNYDLNESFSFEVTKNSVVSIVKTGVVGEGPTQSTLTVDGKTVTQYSETGSITAWTDISDGAVVTEDMTIGTFSCILSGNKVTLADGSTKLIDDVTTEDKLMTFNFYKGELDGNYPMYVMKHENVVADVITVTLDNGTILEMCDWQQFFDMGKKSYFDIDAVNYKEAVGRDIMFIDNGMETTARIVNATLETRICTSYEIFTEYNKNFVANGILTVEPETYLQGVYTIGDDLKIDVEQYQKDVDIYGRYTYEEFADIMTSDEFEKMNIADKKIAVGKGIVSEKWLFALYQEWVPLYR